VVVSWKSINKMLLHQMRQFLQVLLSNEVILLPYVVGGDEVVVESHVATLDGGIVASNVGIAQQNVVASDEAIDDEVLLHQMKQLVTEV